MGLFNKKPPMEKWRSQNKIAAAFVAHTGWDVDPAMGVVHSSIDGTTVTALIPDGMSPGNATMVIVEAGAQAERTLANDFGDDGGAAFEFEGWKGNAAPGSGLLEGHEKVAGTEFFDKIVAAANDLVSRIATT